MLEISRVITGQFATVQKTAQVARIDNVNGVITSSAGELFAIGTRPLDFKLIGVTAAASSGESANLTIRPSDGSVWEDEEGVRYMVFGREIYTSSGRYIYWDNMRTKRGLYQILAGK